MIKTAYIAGSSVYSAECEELANLLETQFNIKITRRWWSYYIRDAPEFEDYSDKEYYAEPQVQMIRELDLKAVKDADIVIIICKEGYSPTGSLVECGYAIAHQKIIIFMGKIKRSSMLSGCIHIKTKDELLELIKRDFPQIEV